MTDVPDPTEAPESFYDTPQEPLPPTSAELADKAVEKATLDKDACPIFNAVDILARLSEIELAKVKIKISEWKRATKIQLNMNDLMKAVAAARRVHSKEKRSKRDQRSHQLPEIMVTNRHIRDVTADALRCLSEANNPPFVFLRSSLLTQIRIDENERCYLAIMSESAVRGQMDRTANYIAVNDVGETIPADPPIKNVKDLTAQNINVEARLLRMALLPGITAVIESPTMRPDGTTLITPGYDPATGLYYAPGSGLGQISVPEHPTRPEIEQAVDTLRSLFMDFPLDGGASIANCFAAIITVIARGAINGKVPAMLFNKPQPGSGGSLLAEAIVLLATGRDVPMYGAPRDPEEFRKLITTILLPGPIAAIIDNVESLLEDENLARSISSTDWGDRVLGFMEEVRVPIRIVWFVTGNNVQLGPNLARRFIQIRLDAKMAQPWKRPASTFAHPNLLEWVREERATLLTAALTLCRAWFSAGKPLAKSPVLGTFEQWSIVVGGILAHAGIKGFMTNLDEMHESADEESTEWSAFLIAWNDALGDTEFSVAEIESRVKTAQRLREALPSDLSKFVVLRAASGFAAESVLVDAKFKQRLGLCLRKRREMRFDGGFYIKQGRPDSHTKTCKWKVVRDGAAPPASPASDSNLDFDSYEESEREAVAQAGM